MQIQAMHELVPALACRMSGRTGTEVGPGREQEGLKLGATEKLPVPSTRLGTCSGLAAYGQRMSLSASSPCAGTLIWDLSSLLSACPQCRLCWRAGSCLAAAMQLAIITGC